MDDNGGTLPQVSQGGQLEMTLHQVNADGGGPYKCMIDSTGTGTQWQDIQVTQNVPGRAGINLRGRKTDFVSHMIALVWYTTARGLKLPG